MHLLHLQSLTQTQSLNSRQLGIQAYLATAHTH